MDPKAPTTLDPKLKEVYDRVMGTGTTPATPPAQPTLQPAPIPNGQLPSPVPVTSLPSHMPATNGMTPPASPIPESKPPIVNTPTPATAPRPIGATPPLSTPTNAVPKPAVDYAALAAKYATPPTPMSTSSMAPPPPPPIPTPQAKATVVSPSTTTYGVANGDVSTKATAPEKHGLSMKKILLIAGIPIALLIYTVVWVVVFGVDVAKLLPF